MSGCTSVTQDFESNLDALAQGLSTSQASASAPAETQPYETASDGTGRLVVSQGAEPLGGAR